MDITIEMIDELIERTGVNYAQAKSALVETKGNLLEAVLLIEKSTSSKENEKEENESDDSTDHTSQESFDHQKQQSTFQQNINEFMKISIGISKDKKEIINLPLWLAVLFAILLSEMILPIFIIGLLLSLFGKFQFKIIK